MSINSVFETALREARQALKGAYEARDLIEQRIVSLKQTIEGLTALCEPETDQDFVEVKGGNSPDGYNTSLTDAIRGVFSESKEYMLTPTEVRDALVTMGVDIKKYKQPLVPIHNTLKRLEAQGEIVPFRDDVGDLRGYRWVSPLARAIAEVDSHLPALRLQQRAKVNPGASNRLETLLRLRETPIDPESLPPEIAASLYGVQRRPIAQTQKADKEAKK